MKKWLWLYPIVFVFAFQSQSEYSLGNAEEDSIIVKFASIEELGEKLRSKEMQDVVEEVMRQRSCSKKIVLMRVEAADEGEGETTQNPSQYMETTRKDSGEYPPSETETNPATAGSFVFPNQRQTSDYIRVLTPLPTLNEFTICAWMKPLPEKELSGTLVSYYTQSKGHNTIFMIIRNGVAKLRLNGKLTVNLVMDKLETHYHQCFSVSMTRKFVKMYVNGFQHFVTNISNNVGDFIPADGTLILGQDQDESGGGFSEQQAFAGTIGHFMIWNWTLSENEVTTMFRNKCFVPEGAVPLITLNRTAVEIEGGVQSNFDSEC